MAVQYKFINKSGDVCTNMNGFSSIVCLPKKIQCVNTDDDGFLQDCDKTYCSIKCENEADYFIPYVIGDKIMFQLQFRDLVNTDIKNPLKGWGDWVFADIYDLEGNFISSGLGLAERMYTCHNGKNSYQVIEFEISKLNFIDEIQVDCFYFKFKAMNGIGQEATEIDSRCSHFYKPADDCMETHLVEGEFAEFDCLGNYYGMPNCDAQLDGGGSYFKYRNTTRIEARFLKRSPETETEDEKTTIIDNYELRTDFADQKAGIFLPNYIISWFVNLFSSKKIKIDNISQNISNFAVDYEQQEPNSAVCTFKWQQKCTTCYG